MIRLRIRYYFANVKLRVRDRIRFFFWPVNDRNSRRSFAPIVDFVSIEDVRYLRTAHCLAHALGHAYIRAQALRMANYPRQLGFRPVTIHIILHKLEKLDEVGNAWDMTFALGSMRDLSKVIPHGKALSRNLDDAFTLARSLALAGADTTMRLFVVRTTPLSRALLAVSTALLPLPDRERYKAEFYAELHEMRKSKKLQVIYATRQLASSFNLRRSLRRNETASQEHASD